jgi:hypothetical protein
MSTRSDVNKSTYLLFRFQWKQYYELASTLVSSTNKIDRHDITEILLQVALNTIKPNQPVIYDHVYILGKPNTRDLETTVHG